MSFARNFEAGSRLAGDLLETYQKARQSRELADIAKAKEEKVVVQQPTFQGMTGGYDEQDAPIQQKETFRFLGKSYDTAPTEDQKMIARQAAMAGVIAKSNPIEGMRMQQALRQQEKDDQRFSWEKDRTERAIRTEKQAEDDKAMSRKIDDEVGSWFEKRLTGEDGARRAPTVDDYMASTQYRAGRLLAAGRVDAAGQTMKEHQAQSLVKIQLESAQRDQDIGRAAAAIASGDLTAARDFYNRYVPDGGRVTDVKRDDKGRIIVSRETVDGSPLPAYTMKDDKQLVATLQSFKNPAALLDWSQREFENNLRLAADRRDQRRTDASIASQGIVDRLNTARADKEEAETAAVRDLGKIRTDLSTAIDAGDAKAEADARKKLLGYATGARSTGSNVSPEERRAMFYLATGAARNEVEAARMAHEKVQSSPKDDYIKLAAPNSMGLSMKEDEIDKHMTAMHGKEWKSKMGDGSGRPAPTKSSPAARPAAPGPQAEGAPTKPPPGDINTDPRAIAIRNSPTMSLEQKRGMLRELGYE